MNNETRCASYYQNLNPELQRLGDPIRCRLERGHLDMHTGSGPGRSGSVRWPDTVQMVHPWTITGRPKPPRVTHQHEAWQLQESAQGGLYCAACGEAVPGG